jgi:hypothetical protein
MNAMKGAGEDEKVVRGEFLQTAAEFSGIDEAASFVYDEEGVNCPLRSVRLYSMSAFSYLLDLHCIRCLCYLLLMLGCAFLL